MDAGAVYLDSAGEPPFIRQVFEEFGPRAEHTGAVLLTAFGYDYVPGNLAGALALQAAGPAGARVRVGYFARGNIRKSTSAGTRASAAGVCSSPDTRSVAGASHRADRRARRVVRSRRQQAAGLLHRLIRAFRAAQAPAAWRASPGTDGVPAGAPRPTWASTSAGSAPPPGSCTRLGPRGDLERLPGVRAALDQQARRIQRSRAAPGAGEAIRSDVGPWRPTPAAVASRRYTDGGDQYSFIALSSPGPPEGRPRRARGRWRARPGGSIRTRQPRKSMRRGRISSKAWPEGCLMDAGITWLVPGAALQLRRGRQRHLLRIWISRPCTCRRYAVNGHLELVSGGRRQPVNPIKGECVMRRAPVAARVAALAGVCTVGVLAIAPAASGARATTRSRAVQVWMAGDQLAAQRFVGAVSRPGSPSYHRFLSPGAYTRRFGPSAAQVKAVEAYLAGAGLTRVRASVNDVYVSALARSGLNVTIPSSIRRDVLAVTGLSGTQPRPATSPRPRRPAARAPPLRPARTTGRRRPRRSARRFTA